MSPLKYLPLSVQSYLLPQTVQESICLAAQGKKQTVENKCDLGIAAPVTLLRMLPKALFNTDFKRKIQKNAKKTHKPLSLAVSNNCKSAD